MNPNTPAITTIRVEKLAGSRRRHKRNPIAAIIAAIAATKSCLAWGSPPARATAAAAPAPIRIARRPKARVRSSSSACIAASGVVAVVCRLSASVDDGRPARPGELLGRVIVDLGGRLAPGHRAAGQRHLGARVAHAVCVVFVVGRRRARCVGGGRDRHGVDRSLDSRGGATWRHRPPKRQTPDWQSGAGDSAGRISRFGWGPHVLWGRGFAKAPR
jgi:hypothetical protein